MPVKSHKQLRLAIITALASELNDTLGRTALMKLVFFLQSRRGIDLGYSFRLYNYGPYDSQVIGDLRMAESLGAVASKEFSWSGGTGYTIGLGSNGISLMKKFSAEILEIKSSVDWVVTEFGKRSAADLEIASTIVFVDDSFSQQQETQSINEMVASVHAIKPHHSDARILAEVNSLKNKQLLNSLV